MRKLIAKNKKARRNVDIEDTFEAGLVLLGSEVKSLRAGNISLDEGFCRVQNGELWLFDAHIPEYKYAHNRTHEPKRERKLLLKAQEIKKISGKAIERGYTIVPLAIYWKGAYVKIEIGIGKGKRTHDKRTDISKREAQREMDRAMKQANQRNR
jgi:SsrA-binding protein